MDNFKKMEEYGYEQLIYFYDKETDLKGITCIHDSTLGPALGGTRLWLYESEEEAVIDVMRLARGMSLKNSAAGLNIGGGKTVLIGDAEKVKSEAFFRAFGRFIESLKGRYITAQDVNITPEDLEIVAKETTFVVGLKGKSGNPSPFTALGAFNGIRATLRHTFQDEDFSKYTFAVQGVGDTGKNLVNHLIKAGAKKIYFTDINKKRIDALKEAYPTVEYVKPEDYFSLDVDVLVPCALGAALNEKTIPLIKARAVAGTANNILANENEDAKALKDRGIVYAPDFVINAGGVINVYHEIHGYNVENVIKDVTGIYDRLLDIFQIADKENITTQEAAKVFAQTRIDSVAKNKK